MLLGTRVQFRAQDYLDTINSQKCMTSIFQKMQSLLHATYQVGNEETVDEDMYHLGEKECSLNKWVL